MILIVHPQRLLSLTIELLLWFAAAFCFCALASNQISATQANLTSLRLLSQQSAETHDSESPSQAGNLSAISGEVIGRLKIPALGISVPMTAGIESASLVRGVGHVEGTAFPGGLGTLALAGHRDTYFRPLEHIAKKMDVQVSDKTGTYHYEVESWEIVTPEEVSVLSIRDKPELVLITCYPFHYIGAAPTRFIVHARLVSLTPDVDPTVVVGGHGHL